ncbi:MAG: T9SS type A sorting domain-containing protein [Ignavibacterium sp.]|nr:T9SS type A sorting domain-containing protein [Ignavibacterium sp.]
MDNERLYRSTSNGETWDLLINYYSLPFTRYGPIEELEGNLLIMQKRETHNMGTLTSLVISNNNFNTRNTIYPTRIYASNITAFTHSLNNAVFVGIENGKIYKSNDILTNIEEDITAANSFMLFQNYPNPFNPSTIISYQLPVSGEVTLKVYDVLGREVETLVNEYRNTGNYEVEFNVAQESLPAIASGIYFYQLKAGEYVQTKKMILLR